MNTRANTHASRANNEKPVQDLKAATTHIMSVIQEEDEFRLTLSEPPVNLHFAAFSPSKKQYREHLLTNVRIIFANDCFYPDDYYIYYKVLVRMQTDDRLARPNEKFNVCNLRSQRIVINALHIYYHEDIGDFDCGWRHHDNVPKIGETRF